MMLGGLDHIFTEIYEILVQDEHHGRENEEQ